ncbi:MAG: hypothetical protein J6J36_00470 [Clostridia bacterium]|nr:hypothetical protein [Clostridia bacterium]
MNLNNVKDGDIFKNWKEFCNAVEIECKKSNNRKGDERKLSALCEWHKEGQKVIIDRIYDIPQEVKDGRKNNRGSSNQVSKYENILTKKERKKEFDGYYVYAHYISDEVVYIGKGCRDRILSSMYQRFNKEDYSKIEIKILKRFGDNELEALAYEKEMIEYYQSIGQCKYNDKSYHIGNIKTEEVKLQKEYDKLISERELLIKRLNMIDLQIESLKDKLA